ncbi:MAG TPA: M20 family metallopeptidase [Saprospiraceae bacterium]|nr:M20 family metallopeptidase [Saprospiraceae bacterium]
MSADYFKKRARSLQSEWIKIRRHLHQNPELSFEEGETATYLMEKLSEAQIEYKSNIAGNGIVATIQGKVQSDKVVCLRADMDALPIQELNSSEYCSVKAGKMHACGHDVHMSCVLGAAILLNELRDDLCGTVRIIFQPAEEKLPGGASLMIKEGVLENPRVSAIFGLHVEPRMSVGQIGVCPGGFMASCDELFIDIIGKGGHAALPEQVVNPVWAAAEWIQKTSSKFKEMNVNGLKTVLSYGKISSNGGATNVIPELVRIEGTFRSLDEAWRQQVHKMLYDSVSEIELSTLAQIKLNLIKGYPSLYNDPQLMSWFVGNASQYIVNQNIIALSPRLTSEDFAYYSRQIPACFFRLGIGKEVGVHNAHFDVNEECLQVGVGLLAHTAQEYLNYT